MDLEPAAGVGDGEAGLAIRFLLLDYDSVLPTYMDVNG
jgi:hypothetical protein